MVAKIISILAGWIIAVISAMGYWGIVLCMAIESACIPLPSEIIMPFSGYLVSTGQFSLIGVTLAGAAGNVIGSLAAYGAGLLLGREFALKHGKYLLISATDLLRAEKWFERYGSAAVFGSRLLPIIRTFISFPAGVARMRLLPFVLYTFVGSVPWCLGLALIGMKMGQNWETLGKYFHQFDIAIGILILMGGIWWVRRHLRLKTLVA